MTKNVGPLDQILRIGISFGLIYMGFINEELIRDLLSSYIIGTIGALNLIVAITQICPLYTLIGISTCQKNK
jgi:hypothetical protein